MLSYEYITFLNEKVLQYLPQPYTVIGDKINFRCMICGDSKKSSTKKRGWWYKNTASFYCFNCGTALSGIKFLKELSGIDYDEIHKEYVKLFLKSNLDTSLSSYQFIPNKPSVFNLPRLLDPNLKKPLTDKAKEYLAKRKVLEAPFLKEKLFSTYSENDRSKEYILIPWVINGVDAYYQINDFLKIKSMKYMFPKGSKKLLYGLDNIDPTYKKIIVFEGVYDSLFVKNGVASGTKSITQYQTDIIHDRWPNHDIVISFDNDQSGFASMSKLIKDNPSMKFFRWFGDNTREKDINERIISLNDTRAFADEKTIDSMIVDGLNMKLWMMNSGKWQIQKKTFKTDRDNQQKKKAFVVPSVW